MAPWSPATGLDRLPRLSAGETLVDSHCHLDMEAFDDDRGTVLERAAATGIGAMVTIGAGGSMDCNRAAIRLARQHASIVATVGIHPHDASTATDEAMQEIEALAGAREVVAIGETGLDYHYDHSPRPRQQEAFRRFADLARRLRLPLIVHLRNADGDAIRILREERATEVGGVIHCFSSSADAARAFLDVGFHISFSGIVTFASAGDVRAAARIVPDDRLLVETDAPYLAPTPFRGRRNEPALIVQTAQVLAQLRDSTLTHIAERTRVNAERLFGLHPHP